jgi:hypothetical protein
LRLLESLTPTLRAVHLESVTLLTKALQLCHVGAGELRPHVSKELLLARLLPSRRAQLVECPGVWWRVLGWPLEFTEEPLAFLVTLRKHLRVLDLLLGSPRNLALLDLLRRARQLHGSQGLVLGESLLNGGSVSRSYLSLRIQDVVLETRLERGALLLRQAWICENAPGATGFSLAPGHLESRSSASSTALFFGPCPPEPE